MVCSLHMKIKLALSNMNGLFLSEVSILALPSHSCLDVQELHTTHTDSERDTHIQADRERDTHTMHIITMNVANIHK